MDATQITPEQVVDALSAHTYRYANERELHAGIAAVLDAHAILYKREVAVSVRDRPDFLCGPVCVEVKIGGDTTAVFAQLQRYAHANTITHLVLATTVADHTSLPGTVGGKPLTVVHLGGIR